PRDWFVRIAAIMQVITVQVGEAMAKIPEAEEKHDVVPVQDTEGDKGGEEENELGDSPECFSFVLAQKSLENSDGIFPKEAEECVAERMLGLAVVAMFVNREPIDRVALFVRPIGIALVVLHV